METVKQKVWLMFWTKGGDELKTKEKIQKLIKDLGLEGKIEKVFVPTIKTTKYVKKRKKLRFYDIIIEFWPKDIPLEFFKIISGYGIGFKGKLTGGIPYAYEPVDESKKVYKLKKIDKNRIGEIFNDLVSKGVKPAIIGVHQRDVDELIKQLQNLNFSVKTLLSAYKPKDMETEVELKVVEKPMFKGYIFILMEEDQDVIDQITRRISNTRPIRAVDPITGQPTYLRASQEDIRKIEKLIEKQEKEKRREAPFMKGDRIRITEGLLKDKEGVVEEVDMENAVLRVRMDLLGKTQILDLKFTQVERIEI